MQIRQKNNRKKEKLNRNSNKYDRYYFNYISHYFEHQWSKYTKKGKAIHKKPIKNTNTQIEEELRNGKVTKC